MIARSGASDGEASTHSSSSSSTSELDSSPQNLNGRAIEGSNHCLGSFLIISNAELRCVVWVCNLMFYWMVPYFDSPNLHCSAEQLHGRGPRTGERGRLFAAVARSHFEFVRRRHGGRGRKCPLTQIVDPR